MELSQIRYFLEAARTQHFTQSAEHMNIAQPALTKSIHNLESELGVSLFGKSGRNVVLTVYGEYLRDRLQPILEELNAIPNDLEQMVKGEKQSIRLSVMAASSFVTNAVIAYKKTHPEVIFHVSQGTQQNDYDIRITTQAIDKKTEKNACFYPEKIYLAVPNNEKFAERENIDLAEIKDEGFIALSGAKQLRTICDGFCEQAGFSPNIIFDSDSPTAVKNMIAANMGVGFWPEYTWGEIDSAQVKLLQIRSPECKRNLIIQKTDMAKKEKTDEFEAFLKKYFSQKGKH